MEAGVCYFDSWDDWDTDWGDSGSGGGDFGGSGNDRSRSEMPAKTSEDIWGQRPAVGGGGSSGPGRNTNEDTEVYVIRGITENPLRGMGAFSKIFRGIPVSANNQINISLMQSGNIGHGGGALNGVIFGKIENQALGIGMRVKVTGKNQGGKFVIRKMWDVDSGNTPVMINHYWKDPLDNGRSSANPLVGKAALILIVLILAALALFMNGGIKIAVPGKVKMIAAIIMILAFIKIFHINIFNNPFVQKVLLFVILVAIALFVPGGDSVMVGAITLYGIYLVIKSITK